MTQARKHTTTPRSAYSICREWRQVHLKCAYDLSIGEEADDEANDLIVAVADATKHELEAIDRPIAPLCCPHKRL